MMITNDDPLPIYGFIIWGVLVFIILANSILGQCLAGWSKPKMGASTARLRIAGTMAARRRDRDHMGITERREKISRDVDLRRKDLELDKDVDWDTDGSHYSQDGSEFDVLGIRGYTSNTRGGEGGWDGNRRGGGRGVGNGSGVERKQTTRRGLD